MTIYLYTGVPGSGKSLDAARDVRYCLNHGRPVLGNFVLGADAPVRHRDLYTYMSNEELSAKSIMAWADACWDRIGDFREDYLLLVVDEAQLKFNSRRWSENNRMAFLELLSQSRKYGIKVILIAQGDKMIDNQFRMLVDTQVIHRKLSTCGMPGFILSLPFGGRVFVRISVLYSANERLGAEWFLYSKKDARMYDSYAKFRRDED